MKRKYEAPSAEMLEFNYADIVTASDTPTITMTQNRGCEDSPITTPSGWTEHGNNSGCEKLNPTTDHNWNQCSS